MTFFNPLDTFYKSQIGAVCTDKVITFRVKGNFNSVVLLLKKDENIEDYVYVLENKGEFFETSIKIEAGLYFYCFSLGDNKFIGLGEDYKGVITSEPVICQLSVYEENFTVPEWINLSAE